MNNYIRYYDRDNSETPQRPWHSNVLNHQEASSSHDLLPEVLESEPEVHKDEKNRRVISRDDLYEDPELFYKAFNQEASQTPVNPDNSWTQQNWLRAGESSYESDQRTRRQPVNKIQKRLTAAMAQPVQMSKAESMMQKMGWQGGALGRTGDGIVEPITPNAVYATKTRGFGNAEPLHRTNTKPQQKEKKIDKHALKKHKLEHFTTTALLHILEFVKNDKEIEIIFDPKLYKYERKAIHKLVNEVINNEDMAGMNFDSVAQIDVITDIHKYNNYVLCTQSEGEEPNRILCVYKEAPEHVYLVTPSDLKDEIPDEDISDDNDDKTNAVNDTNDQNKAQENDVKSKSDAKNQEVNCTNSKVTDKSEDKELNDEIKNDKPNIMEVDEEENPFLRSITRNLRNAHETEVTSTEPKDTIDTPNQSQTIDCSIDNPNESQTSKEKTAVEKIIDYFIEFSADEVYSEFRFLGPFDPEEIDRINEFINNLHACICNGSCDDEKYENIMKCTAKDQFVFEIREDCNGSPVIYKYKKESR